MAELLDQIKQKLNEALKGGQERSVAALRFLLASVHNEEITQQRPLKDEEILALVRRQVKKHEESIEAFQKGGREDLVQKEKQEKTALEAFLPQGLGEEEIRKMVKEVIASGPKDFGPVMGQVMGKVKGQADGAVVAGIVKEELHG